MQMRLERDPERVKQLADQRQDANWAFRCFLKRSPLSSRSIDSIVHKHYRAVAAEIDCRQCANCCKAARPLLKENLCTTYPCRPADCRSYPHIQKKDFVFRLNQAILNCSVCPIVVNVFELLKRDLWRGRRSEY